MMSGKTEDLFADVDDSLLGRNDLKDIRVAISLIEAQWHDLGGNLGLQPETLETIAANFQRVERRFTEMIVQWLNWNYDYEKEGKPSWKNLVKAVHRINPTLAISIAKARGTGTRSNGGNRKRSRHVTPPPPQQVLGDDEADLGNSSSPPVEKKPRRLALDHSSPVEQKTVADPRWCTAVTKFEVKANAGPVSEAPAAVAVIQALWKKKTKLRVKFIGDKSLLRQWKLDNGNQMTTEMIITWANTWRDMCDSPNVPFFVDIDTVPGLKESDIRVDFNNGGANWSWVGMEATQHPNEATMQLCLKEAWCDGLKRYYIIHEFGHVLGLGHEHQRSKFWEFLHPYVNLEMMKQDPVVGGDANFSLNWEKKAIEYYTSDAGDNSGEYDPESIMHYGFKVEWLNRAPIGGGGKNYSVLSNIQSDYNTRILSENAYKVLLGVHQHGNLSLSMNPSNEDISFLKKCYDPGISNPLHGPIQGPGQIQVPPPSGPPPSSDSQYKEQKELPEDVTSWSIQQVFDYFSSLPDCEEYAQFFMDQKISGESLLDLTRDDLRDYGVKLGPLKVMMRHICELQKQQMSED